MGPRERKWKQEPHQVELLRHPNWAGRRGRLQNASEFLDSSLREKGRGSEEERENLTHPAQAFKSQQIINC